MLIKGRSKEFALGCGKPTLIMGILNITPDSFSDGGVYNEKNKAVKRALEMVSEGADIIDVGGESTRPGSVSVGRSKEIERVMPIVEELCSRGVTVSIDTTGAGVARAALEAGAFMVNDVSAMSDPLMAGVVKEFDAAVVLMHMRGTPDNMQADTAYDDIIGEISSFFAERIEYALGCGISLDNIAVDPGLGFGKSVNGNIEILATLSEFRGLKRPILIGASRKSFLDIVLAESGDPAKRLTPLIAAHTAAILAGALILRVHDVKEAREAASMSELIRDAAHQAFY